MLKHFINVDDDEIHNMLCEMTIKNYVQNANVIAFSNPLAALEHIKTTYKDQEAPDTLLFLDINMPGFSGWDFLEEFERLHCSIKNQISVCILSSSIDVRDKERAYNDKNVFQYIEKPLTILAITEILKRISVQTEA